MDQILVLTPIPTIVLDPSFHVSRLSESYRSIFGLDTEDCLGISILEFLESKTPELDHVSILSGIEAAVANKAVQSFEVAATTDERYWTIRVVPIIGDGSLIYVVIEAQDTTEEHRRQKVLDQQQQTDETYRMLVQTVKDYAIFMLDARGYVVTWNTGAGLLKGYAREEIVRCKTSEP